MPQFFIDKKFSAGDKIEFRSGDARHISQSLRLGVGDWLRLSDGEGNSFRAIIASVSPMKVTATIEEKISRKRITNAPVLALAVVKGDRFEWAIEKAVELGCHRIIPFTSERTVPQYAKDAGAKKLKRWQKVALSAAKQSGLPFQPVVSPLVNFSQLFEPSKDYASTFLFFEGEKEADIKSWLKKNKGSAEPDLLIVGPEGGFSAAEIALAKQKCAVLLSLGSQILRVETAAIASIAIWQYEMGNMLVLDKLKQYSSSEVEKY